MVLDDELQGAELDELQQLASQFMDASSEPTVAATDRPKVHSDDFDIISLTDGEL